MMTMFKCNAANPKKQQLAFKINTSGIVVGLGN